MKHPVMVVDVKSLKGLALDWKRAARRLRGKAKIAHRMCESSDYLARAESLERSSESLRFVCVQKARAV